MVIIHHTLHLNITLTRNQKIFLGCVKAKHRSILHALFWYTILCGGIYCAGSLITSSLGFEEIDLLHLQIVVVVGRGEVAHVV